MTIDADIVFRLGSDAGASYLRHALDIYFFPEFWQVRTAL